MADTTTIAETLMTADELAAVLKLSLRNIWRLKSAGMLPKPVKIGGSVRWKKDEILAWIDAGCPSLNVWENSKR